MTEKKDLLFSKSSHNFNRIFIFFQLKHSDLTSRIIGICIEVHKELGPGLLESIYEQAICLELALAGLSFQRQQGIHAYYKGIDMDIGFRADIIVEDSVILEIKSVESVNPVHKKTVISYLRLAYIEVALLVNFNVVKLTDGITRLVQDKRKS